MSWNRPSGAPKPEPKKPSAKRVLGALCLVLCVALGVGAYFLFSGGDDSPAQSTRHKAQGTIREATPAAAPKSVEKEEPKKPIWEQPMPAGMDPDSQEAWKRKMADAKKFATDKRLHRYLAKELKKKSQMIFHSGTEQVLDWIFYSKVGDQVPPPLPGIPGYELNHLEEILTTPNEISKDDPPEIVVRKKAVDEAKKEMLEYVKGGGDPNAFLEHYRNELEQAQALKSQVASEINKQVDASDDADDTLAFVEKANKLLEARGIPGVELTEEQKEIITEKLAEKDKK